MIEASLPTVIVSAAASIPKFVASVPTVSIAKEPPELRVTVVPDVVVDVTESVTTDPAESNSVANALTSTSAEASLPACDCLGGSFCT